MASHGAPNSCTRWRVLYPIQPSKEVTKPEESECILIRHYWQGPGRYRILLRNVGRRLWMLFWVVWTRFFWLTFWRFRGAIFAPSKSPEHHKVYTELLSGLFHPNISVLEFLEMVHIPLPKTMNYIEISNLRTTPPTPYTLKSGRDVSLVVEVCAFSIAFAVWPYSPFLSFGGEMMDVELANSGMSLNDKLFFM